MRRSRPTRAAVLAALLTAGLGLAGCATGTDDPATSPTASSSSPSPTQEPTDEPTDDASTGAVEGEPATNGPNSILVPGDGAVVEGPTVTVSGDGTAFEATLSYTVTDDTDAVVAEGFTTAGANGEVGPYEFELTLEPGVYTVTVFEPGMGEGDAGGEPLNPVQVTFTVE